MDEIATGYSKIMEKIDELKKTEGNLEDTVRKNDAKLLSRMADSAVPVVKAVGMNLLKKGKQDTKGEIYDPQYYPQKMIILGKAETAGFRPDNPQMPVTDQFCVLSEDGDFFELMYSFDGFLTDSYLTFLPVLTDQPDFPVFLFFSILSVSWISNDLTRDRSGFRYPTPVKTY
jgi:hypothetical protein